MLEIKATKVYGLEESIIASGYAMTTEEYDYEKEVKHLKYFEMFGDFLPKFSVFMANQGKDIGDNNKTSCKRCGSSNGVQNYKGTGYYCSRHRHHLDRYGKIIENVEYELLPNNVVKLKIRGNRGEIKTATINACDLPRVFEKQLDIDSNGYLRVNETTFSQFLIKELKLENVKILDHVSRDKSDNTRGNLRPATYQQNLRNKDCKGVCFNKNRGKWKAYISVDKKQIHIGYFDTEQEAIINRLNKEKELFGQFSPNIEKFKDYGIEIPAITTLNDNEYSIEIALKHFNRIKRLSKAGGGSGHSNARTGIIVQFDVKYPQYISPEMQRYHFLQIITSQSKMHRLLKMDLDKMCNQYVEKETIDIVNHLITDYNLIVDEKPGRDYIAIPLIVELRNGEKIECKSKEEALYTIWMQILSNCPLGLEMWMRVSLNYEQLATIYKQRRHHKLKEDWGAFCDWIETLPYAKELIICED